jgi:TetR/AcrR family transcriptional regulator, transcriptional repressor for nem operon
MLQDIQSLSRSHGSRKVQLYQTRDKLLQVGTRRVMESGWAATGIDAVLRECDVPKGSFYHYFASKEAFGYALIDAYHADYVGRLNTWFAPQNRDGLGAMQAAVDGFLAQTIENLHKHAYRQTCLLAALGQELAGTHEGFRTKLAQCLAQWEAIVASALLRTARHYLQGNSKSDHLKTVGLLKNNLEKQIEADCAQFSQEFWVIWQGALWHSLVHQRPDLLQALVKNFMAQWVHWLTGLSLRPVGKTSGSLAHQTAEKKRNQFENHKKSNTDATRNTAFEVKKSIAEKSKKSIEINNLQPKLDF